MPGLSMRKLPAAITWLACEENPPENPTHHQLNYLTSNTYNHILPLPICINCIVPAK